MFLIRLIHLKKIPNLEKLIENIENSENNLASHEFESLSNIKKNIEEESIKKTEQTKDQIKTVIQEKKEIINNEKIPKLFSKKNPSEKIISCFDDLIVLCSRYKEMKLKYDLEKNVRLVKFLNGQMEFSFNENLDKNFIKNLSRKLFEWTNERWIITLSKEKGQPTRQESKYEIKKNLLNELVNTDFYKKTIEAFPDAELILIDNEEEIK